MCEEEDSMLRSWSELPMSALTLTFEKLPLEYRAGTEDCVARVCKSWAEAAAAATMTIALEECSNIDSLQQWLHSRGSSVREVDLSSPSGLIATLPCPKLEGLVVKDSIVDLRPGSQLLRDLCSATALTRLDFFGVKSQGDPNLAAVLLSLPNLQEFALSGLQQEGDIKVQQSGQEQLLHTSIHRAEQDSTVLSQQLWSAHGDPLDGFKALTDSGMQFICKLTKLHYLQLGSLQYITASGLVSLAGLQRLEHLIMEDLTCNISLSAVPAFSQLTGLTGLELRWEPDCNDKAV